MNIAIFGLGITGDTLYKWLRGHTKHELKKIDPRLGFNDPVDKGDVVFICVDAATKEDGSQDLHNIYTVLNSLGTHDGPVFLRSTVTPGTCNRLSRHYWRQLGIFSMPEFLTERTRHECFESQPIMTSFVGVDGVYYDAGLFYDKQILKAIFPGKDIILASNIECELAKYAHNCFGAVKVAYFNLIYFLCQNVDADFENVLRGVFLTGFINKDHTKVPGPDGKLGFGGKCFPKDLHAFSAYLDKTGLADENFLKYVGLFNDKIRN